MKNGYTKVRPKDAALKAAGFWIVSGPTVHGHRLYYWTRGRDECGLEWFSAGSAENEAREILAAEKAKALRAEIEGART